MPTPVSVWPVGPLRACTTPGCTPAPVGPPCAGQLPDRLWYRAVAAFSRRGDLVLLADAGTGAAVAACADFDRRVIARAASRATRHRIRVRALTSPTDTQAPGVIVFGDRPRRRTGRLLVTWPARTHRRPASLLLVPTPCTTGDRHDQGGPHFDEPADAWQRQVIADAVHLLHPGALVVAVTAGTADGADTGGFDDPAGRIIAAGRDLGLTYLQHIVAIHADLTDGHLTLPPNPVPASGAGRPADHPGAGAGGRHRRAHLDLIVLAVPGGPRDA